MVQGISPIPIEQIRVIDSGVLTIAASARQNLLGDNTKRWAANIHQGRIVIVRLPTGEIYTDRIVGNTETSLVVANNLNQAIQKGSSYEIDDAGIAGALREVLGQGANISPTNPLETHDPKVGSLISQELAATADGALDGSTIACDDLILLPDYDGQMVIITSGDYAGQSSEINGPTTGGIITVTDAFGGQIPEDTEFTIVAMRPDSAAVASIVTALAAQRYVEYTADGTSVAAYADALDIDTRTLGRLTIKVCNDDAGQSLEYRVLLRPENGVAEQLIQPEDITIAFGDYDIVNIEYKWGQIIIQVRDGDGAADYRIYAIASFAPIGV